MVSTGTSARLPGLGYGHVDASMRTAAHRLLIDARSTPS
jgi:hypothetical protein